MQILVKSISQGFKWYACSSNTYYCPTFDEEKDEDKAWPHESDEEAAACAGLECSLPQESYEVVNSQGPAETRGQLPPPLQPQVLPSAKLAAVKQQIGSSLNYDIGNQLSLSCWLVNYNYFCIICFLISWESIATYHCSSFFNVSIF